MRHAGRGHDFNPQRRPPSEACSQSHPLHAPPPPARAPPLRWCAPPAGMGSQVQPSPTVSQAFILAAAQAATHRRSCWRTWAAHPTCHPAAAHPNCDPAAAHPTCHPLLQLLGSLGCSLKVPPTCARASSSSRREISPLPPCAAASACDSISSSCSFSVGRQVRQEGKSGEACQFATTLLSRWQWPVAAPPAAQPPHDGAWRKLWQQMHTLAGPRLAVQAPPTRVDMLGQMHPTDATAPPKRQQP